MAKPPIVRSLNYELIEGASDGTVKKSETANGTRPVTQYDRSFDAKGNLFNGLNGYGIEEAGAMALDNLKGVVRGC